MIFDDLDALLASSAELIRETRKLRENGERARSAKRQIAREVLECVENCAMAQEEALEALRKMIN